MMPTYQFEAMLTRIGLALAAGVLIAIVPIALRKAHHERSIIKRVIANLVALAALIGFCFYGWYLWQRFIPREPEAPAPLEYPVAPAPVAVEAPAGP
jgi:TRAP-type C4-dicarboxylate transport system permease small subunit